MQGRERDPQDSGNDLGRFSLLEQLHGARSPPLQFVGASRGPHAIILCATAPLSVFTFAGLSNKGDLVIIPLKTRPGALAVGEVTGPYVYRRDLGKDVLHTLPVKWLSTDLPRAALSK